MHTATLLLVVIAAALGMREGGIPSVFLYSAAHVHKHHDDDTLAKKNRRRRRRKEWCVIVGDDVWCWRIAHTILNASSAVNGMPAPAASPADPECFLRKIVSFGDSLSDVGTYATTVCVCVCVVGAWQILVCLHLTIISRFLTGRRGRTVRRQVHGQQLSLAASEHPVQRSKDLGRDPGRQAASDAVSVKGTKAQIDQVMFLWKKRELSGPPHVRPTRSVMWWGGM